jgi:putative ABC transport system substrate-binding protein
MIAVIRRREFITLLGGVAAAWPLAASAQQVGKLARIGFLGSTFASFLARRVEGFRSGLRDLGYVEGTTITIEYRWADERYERLPALASELVDSNVDVIVTHGTPGSLAAKQATTTIPIVMTNIGDAVAAGIVASVARPGGNITGQSFFNPELSAKRLELLKELMPRLTRVAALLNADNSSSLGPTLHAMEIAARSLKVELYQFPARRSDEFESAFERMARAGIEAVVIDDDAVFSSNMGAIAALATNRGIVSIGGSVTARDGGVIAYGVDLFVMFRRAAVFVDKILKGTKPADIPIEQATKFEFVLNLKTARALGLDVPTATLLRADEVIE